MTDDGAERDGQARQDMVVPASGRGEKGAPQALPPRRATAMGGAAVVAGWLIGQFLHRLSPVGRNIFRDHDVASILDDRRSPAIGFDHASLRVAIFNDYRCPACRLADPALAAAARADGDVRLIYKEWPIFGPRSEQAARIALASAEQGVFASAHAALMTDGGAWNPLVFRQIVETAGGDWSRLAAISGITRAISTRALPRTAAKRWLPEARAHLLISLDPSLRPVRSANPISGACSRRPGKLKADRSFGSKGLTDD